MIARYNRTTRTKGRAIIRLCEDIYQRNYKHHIQRDNSSRKPRRNQLISPQGTVAQTKKN